MKPMISSMWNEEEEGDTVYSYFESDAFKSFVKSPAGWVELGYINKDLITNPSPERC